MPQFHVQDGPSFFQFEPELPLESGLSIWRDDDTTTLAPSADPGLWKGTAVQLVQFDLQARLTTAWLADGTSQQFQMPHRVHHRLSSHSSEQARQQVILDVWGSHVLKDLVLPPTPALWQMQMELRDAQSRLPSASAALDAASENVQRLVEMARSMRDAVVAGSEPGQALQVHSVPREALTALLHGLEADIDQARSKVGDMQARVDYHKDRQREDSRRSFELQERQQALAHQFGGAAEDNELLSPGGSEGFDTADSSEDCEENRQARSEQRLAKARALRDQWHDKLEAVLCARENVQNRLKELEGSMRSRLRQRWSFMTASAPSQTDRLCLSHQALCTAVGDAKAARAEATEAHSRVVEAIAEAEDRLAMATGAFNAEVNKMQQCGGAQAEMGARVRRNSFSACDDEGSVIELIEIGSRRVTGQVG